MKLFVNLFYMYNMLMNTPPTYNSELSDVANFNSYGSFSFLADEPDLYTDKDLKERYT